MRIVGLMVVGPGEADKWLQEALDDFKRLEVDDAIIVGNNTTPKEEAIIKKTGYRFYRDDREWGKEQPRIKTTALKRAGELDPDWILAKDADEIFDDRITREGLEALAERGGVGWYFYVVNYWNSTERYAQGLSFWNIRFYRFAPEFGLDFINKPVHCGLAPPIAYKHGNYSPYILWHYGIMEPEARQRKVKRYEKYDPNAQYKSDIYYDALKWTGNGAILDIDNLREKVAKEVENYKVKSKPVEETKKGWVYMTRDGRTIDVEAKHAHRYERQGWKVLSEIKIKNDDDPPEAPVIKKKVEEDVVEIPVKSKRRGRRKVE